ncbi:hypothetical protein [Streptomyces sp. NPDC101132]|uniref:hypothetical protein n=1 Tax=Streptomyces sp. NPDC101132 TaxID=3366110 RepID=UPI003805BF04
MMLLLFVGPPLAAMGALLALVAVAPPASPRTTYVWPAVRTIAGLCLLTIYVAILWGP